MYVTCSRCPCQKLPALPRSQHLDSWAWALGLQAQRTTQPRQLHYRPVFTPGPVSPIFKKSVALNDLWESNSHLFLNRHDADTISSFPDMETNAQLLVMVSGARISSSDPIPSPSLKVLTSSRPQPPVTQSSSIQPICFCFSNSVRCVDENWNEYFSFFWNR